VDEFAANLTKSRADLESQAKALNQRRIELGQLHGRVEAFQQTLQPIQDHLNGWNESLDSLYSPLESAASQQQQIALELKQRILTLGQASTTN
jgi:predicted  nucleic acid-binding Zn-ribbon protein